MSVRNRQQVAERVHRLFQQQQRSFAQKTDRNFALLMMVQFAFGLLVSTWVSPWSWSGVESEPHVHVWAALLLGGVITSLPVYLALVYPGRVVTRHVVAIGQMLMGALLIHLMGGRIETHFHVFGSLAFLAFYRDWKVMVTATLVVAADHFFRGMFWPFSVFGTNVVQPFRWLEHIGWVLFEDLFLLISIQQSTQRSWNLAQRQADLEAAKSEVESERDRFFDLSVDMLCLANVEGYFVRVNPSFLLNLGYTAEELTSKPFLEFVHPEDRDATRDALSRLQAGGDVVDFENRYQRSDGEYRWLAWSTRAPRPGDTLLYAVARDVTARKEAARALERATCEAERARQAAEQANRAKSDFLATMSHEIRTPLNAVIGMTELVLETELDGMQRDFLRTVLESGESLLTIINEILDFSKIEAGHVKLENHPFSLSELLGDTLRSLAVRAHASNLELACRIAPNVPDGLRGDVTRIRQVLINLVGNAIKFTSQGEVVVNVEAVGNAEAGCGGEAGGDGEAHGNGEAGGDGGERVELHFSVRDTGIGISDDQKQRIFEAFTQADMSTTRRFGGTGLGLSICRTLVGLMSGRIWVESQVGVGSTFHFTACLERLPRDEAEALEVHKQLDLDGVRVLVVDDHAVNRRILEEMLRTWNMRPLVVEDAPAAWEQLRNADEPFQLLISDLQMPGEDGLSLVARVRQRPELAKLPVVLLSSGFQPNDLQRCEQLDVRQPLLKPVKRSDLLRAITDAMLDPHPAVPRGGTVSAPAAAEVERPLRVLFVEDGLANQRLGQRLLEMWGYDVTLATNGREAIERLGQQDFDVVLMDVRMPEMDGLEATRRIRAAEGSGGRRVPILALTAHALKGDREICLEAGMDGYVSKPFRKEELLEALRSVLAANRDAQA